MTAGPAAAGLAALLPRHSAGASAATAAAAASAAALAAATAAASAPWLAGARPLPALRNPFVAHAAAAGGAAAAPARAARGACPLGYGSAGQEAAKAAHKSYPAVALPSILSTLAPRNLAWVWAKNQALVTALQLNAYFYEVLEAEEAALEVRLAGLVRARMMVGERGGQGGGGGGRRLPRAGYERCIQPLCCDADAGRTNQMTTTPNRNSAARRPTRRRSPNSRRWRTARSPRRCASC